MFERLASAIDDLEVPLDGSGLAAAVALLDRSTAKVTAAVGALDAGGGWSDEGATSMTAWLRHHGGLTAGQAASMVRTAGVLRRLPATREAWVEQRLSGGQVQAVVGNVRPATVDLFAAAEEAIVDAVARLSVADTATALQHWARRAEALVEDATGRDTERSLHVSTTLGGRVELSGSLDRRAAPWWGRPSGVASTVDVEAEPARTPAERRADALVDVCRWFLDHQGVARGGRRRPHRNVIVDVDQLGSGRAGRWSTDRRSVGPPSTGCCATRRCTGS